VPHSFAVGGAQSLAIFAKAGAREWAVVQGIRFKLLYGFTGRLDGGVPGNLCGVTLEGGTGGYGVIYELSPRSRGQWKETVLYNVPSSEAYAEGSLVLNHAGNLNGTQLRSNL
jgi:hypothetical protein